MSEMIVFNGKTYDSLEQMPPMERKAYETIKGIFADLDGDGVPDLFKAGTVVQVENTSPQIIFEGRSYNSVDELPVEAQARYQAAMGKLDADRNGIPDLMEERLGLRTAGAEAPDEKGASQPDWLKDAISQTGDTVFANASAIKSNYSQNLEPEGINWRTVIISALLTGFVCLGAVTLWFYLAQ